MKRLLLFALMAVALLPSAAQNTTLYPWEESRTAIPKFAHMALCYGGSTHRTPYLWPQNRFGPMVTCKDAQGNEQWLFDSFLAIEFVEANIEGQTLAYGFGYNYSADKASWQRLISYWFKSDNGFDALDKAIGSAIKRIGEPPTKRTVLITLPDPIMHYNYADASSSSLYWGELDGKQMDFSRAADRIAALKWYVDEVRAHWDKANYQNIEFMGFYIISEDLAIPGDGWSAELKHYEDIFPTISRYIHRFKEGVYWIPYYKAAPYTKWRTLGIDVAIMQPNMFWGQHPTYTFKEFNSMITSTGMGMELEFDEKLLGSTTEAEEYKARFREYLEAAKSYGIYGKKPIAVYSGENDFYKLSQSTNRSDKRLFRELCDFFLNDPYRLGGIAAVKNMEKGADAKVMFRDNTVCINGAAGAKCTVFNLLGAVVAKKNRLAASEALKVAVPAGSVIVVNIEQNGKTQSYKVTAR